MKKFILNTMVSLFLGAMLIGCSSDGSSTEVIPLVVGEEIQVLSGDKINPVDNTTQIEIRHVLESDTKYVTLLSGSAELIRGNFNLVQ